MNQRERGLALKTLFAMKEWDAVVEIFSSLSSTWKGQLLHFTDQDSLEKLARDRIRCVASINAMETFFRQINEDMKSLEKKEEEKKPIRKSRNPYRD